MVSAQYLGTENPPPLLASLCVSVFAKEAGFLCGGDGGTSSNLSFRYIDDTGSGCNLNRANTSSVSVSAINFTETT
jgi:hypothetical protein